MLHLLSQLWNKTNRRRPTNKPARSRRNSLNLEQLESRSMLSVAPAVVTVPGLGGEPVQIELADLSQFLNRREDGSWFLGRDITIQLTTRNNRDLTWLIDHTAKPSTSPRDVFLPTNTLTGEADLSGYIYLNAASGSSPAPTRTEPALERESLAVRQFISGLNFTVKQTAPSILDRNHIESQASPVQRPKTIDKPQTVTKPAVAETPQIAPLIADNAEGGMVNLLRHKVADQSAMMTTVSAANVQSVLDHAVQIDRAYGTFQAFELSSGEKPVRLNPPVENFPLQPSKSTEAHGPEFHSPEFHNPELYSPGLHRAEIRKSERAVDDVSLAPSPELLTDLAALDIPLDAGAVDQVFAVEEIEQQLEGAVNSPSVFQLVAAVAIATAAYRAHSYRTREPDKTNPLRKENPSGGRV